MKERKKLAIIGSGISGLSTAYFLNREKKFDITIYEKNNCLGGHSRTIDIYDKKDKENIAVDTGFIVFNKQNYPNLVRLFSDLNVVTEKTEMSFSVFSKNAKQNFEWSGSSVDSFFAQRKNIFNISVWKGILDIVKFNKHGVKFVYDNPNMTMGEFIDKNNFGNFFKNKYIMPMGGSIWSSSAGDILNFPAKTFIEFFKNHGLLSIKNRPQWYTLNGKSREYIEKIKAKLKGANIITNAKIEKIERTNRKVLVKQKSKKDIFDEIVFACHPKEILKMLDKVSSDEKRILSKFKRQKNVAYTHCDTSQMPTLKKCWSSWNCCIGQNDNKGIFVTYWMNKLQHIKQSFPLFITLNPVTNILQSKIYDKHEFYHPIFDFDAIDGQKEIKNIQGETGTWFCGAFLRNGFHEDGIWSAASIAKHIMSRV